MKKFLLCIMVALFSASMWQSASARYVLSDRIAADEIKAGDTIALWCGTQGNLTDYYLGVTEGGALEHVQIPGLWNARASWIVSEGPKDYKGNQTYFLQNLETLEYFGSTKADPMNNGIGSLGLQADIEYAIPLSIHLAADSSEVNEQYGPSWDDVSAVFCFAREGDKPLFVCGVAYWGIATVHLWEYKDTNAYNAFRVFYQHDLQGDLQALIDEISEAGIEYDAGDKPGQYPQEAVDKFNAALEYALLISLEEHTDAEYQEAMDRLIAAKEAVERSVNPITEGYYYIVSAYPEFVNKQGVEQAMTVNSEVQLGWKAYNAEDLKQIWHIVPLANGNFTIQNYENEKYINGSETTGNSKKVLLASVPTNEQIIKPIGSLQWEISNTFNSVPYHPESHSSGNGTGGDIVTYPNQTGINDHSTWYIRLVEDSIMEKLPAIKAQNERTDRLSALAKEANTIWDNITYYTVSPENAITDADDEKDDSERQVWSNAKDPIQGTYAALIDSLTSIFHSTWHVDNDPLTKPHNLQFDFSAAPISGFEVRMLQRCDSWGNQDRPTIINFYASNEERDELTEDDAWTFIRQIDITNNWGNNTETYQNWVTTPTIDLGKDYKYVRMDVLATGSSRKNTGAEYPFFSLAELYVFPVTLDETLSQYCYTEGLAPLADKMYELAKEAAFKIADNVATEADINELRAAIDAVKELYADTTEIAKLANVLQTYASTAVFGTGIGETTEEAALALQAAVDEAKESSFTTPLVKSEIDAAMAKLQAAKAEFLKTVKMPEVGKWYHILSASDIETHYNGGNLEAPLPMANSALYADGPNNSGHIRYGLLSEDGEPNYEYNPYSMWRLVETGEEGKYALQSLGAGMYIGDGNKLAASIYNSSVPVAYDIQLLGNASFGLYPDGGADNGYALMACFTGQHAEVGEAEVFGDGSWKFKEIDPNETEFILTDIFANNLIDVIAMPYDLNAISDFNEGVVLYGIKKMTKNDDGTTTVELYEKTELAAGESGIIVLGDPEQDKESYELIVPFPTEVVDKAFPVNGIYGMLQSEVTPAGTAYSDGTKFVCRNEQVGIGANTGAINVAYYEGEVEGVETALTIVIEGLDWTVEKPDGIEGAVTVEDIVNAIRKGAYTISGQKVAEPQKGQIYIIDGKKVKY